MLFSKSPNCAQKFPTLILLATSLAVVAPAEAGRGNPAPIIFKGDASATTRHREHTPTQSSGVPVAQTRAPSKSKRVEFRYPDRPDTVYGGAGPTQASSQSPIRFSSATSAIAPEQARQYASIEPPVTSVPKIVHDPAITTGGFDARAAAQRVSQQQHVERAVPQEAVTQVAAEPLPKVSRQTEIYTPPATPSMFAPPSNMQNAISVITYGDEFVGYPTANGEMFSQAEMTGAHPTLPLPSLVHLSNPATGQEVVVRVNDRGPFEDGAGLQVSRAVSSALGANGAGQGQMVMRYLGSAPAKPTYQEPPAALGNFPQSLAATYEVPAQRDTRSVKPVQASYQDNFQTGRYFVQLGSFSDIGNAQYLSRQLDTNLSVSITTARVKGADYFRVIAGPFETRESAQSLRDQLHYDGVANGRVIDGK